MREGEEEEGEAKELCQCYWPSSFFRLAGRYGVTLGRKESGGGEGRGKGEEGWPHWLSCLPQLYTVPTQPGKKEGPSRKGGKKGEMKVIQPTWQVQFLLLTSIPHQDDPDMGEESKKKRKRGRRKDGTEWRFRV